MAGAWSLDKLVATSGETEHRLHWYADAGLLYRQSDGDFEPDSLHRVSLIEFARSRGVSEEELAAATARQGDLLGLFVELAEPSETTVKLADTARELGLDEDVISELAEIPGWDDVGFHTESDVGALRVVAHALQPAMPRDAVMPAPSHRTGLRSSTSAKR